MLLWYINICLFSIKGNIQDLRTYTRRVALSHASFVAIILAIFFLLTEVTSATLRRTCFAWTCFPSLCRQDAAICLATVSQQRIWRSSDSSDDGSRSCPPRTVQQMAESTSHGGCRPSGSRNWTFRIRRRGLYHLFTIRKRNTIELLLIYFNIWTFGVYLLLMLGIYEHLAVRVSIGICKLTNSLFFIIFSG